jgi:hypothetical protein
MILCMNDGLRAQDTHHVDAWGVTARPLVAAGEVIGINVFAWSVNYYVRQADFTVVYPRTWWDNIMNGFKWDTNPFATNLSEHAYHGALYHNAARSNGMGFWSALPLTLAGSLMWECCAERHPMAGNDVFNTTLGGMALGEVIYRTSSAVLDNEATGAERGPVGKWRASS